MIWIFTSPLCKSWDMIFMSQIEKAYILIKLLPSSMRGKRGQSAVEVSVLIFLIAVGMVGYIILLPAEEREALLGETATTTTTAAGEAVTGKVLLSESPGEVGPAQSTTQTRLLEPIRLYSTTESNSKSLASSLSISRNILQNNYKTITFDVDNLNELEKMSLLFLISESKGDLSVTLNDNLVFEGELTSNDLPLELPVDYLVETDNKLTLSSDLSAFLFVPHYYLLQDIQLIQDFTVADTSSSRTFSVDDPGEVTSATLTYFITCNADEDGILTISLNNREVFSDRVFCEYLNERELGLDEDFLQNTNTLKFEITQGDYNVEEVAIAIKSKSKDYPTFSFDIESDLFEEIAAGTKEVYLKMSFSDDTSEKQATVLVQDYSFNFDTESDTYEKKITSYIDDGSNRITIQPSSSFEIDNVQVYVQ